MSSNGWNHIDAQSFCIKVTDGTHDSPKRKEIGRYLITSKHIKGRNIDFCNSYLISEEDYNKINQRSKVDQWDVLISMIGEYCGFCYIERNPTINYAVKNVGIFKTGSKAKAEWIYYYLNSPEGKNSLASLKSGTSQPYLSLGSLRTLPILVPNNNEEMEAINNILSALDDKIELNNRMNKVLEQMAQAIFKKWFVDFEFPNENGKPYKSSGGKMVICEELGKEIPRGWRYGNASEIFDVLSGGTPKTDNDDYWNGNIPFFTPKDCTDSYFVIETEKYINQDGLNNCNSKLYPVGTVLITARGTVGKIAIAGYSMAMNQSCYALKAREGFTQYFVFLQMRELVRALQKNASGAVFEAITVGTFKTLIVCLPKHDIVQNFEKIIGNVFGKLHKNVIANRVLTNLRGTLLPKLMSGEIDVSNVEL